MFEKEAEEWVIDSVCKDCSRYEKCKSREHCTCKECSKEKWQKGAEFGYNKGFEFGVKSNEKVNQIVDNEWHYVKDELPSESAMLLLARKTINGVQALIGYYRSNQFEIFNEKSCVMQNIDSVYAWKEIVLPKETE